MFVSKFSNSIAGLQCMILTPYSKMSGFEENARLALSHLYIHLDLCLKFPASAVITSTTVTVMGVASA